VILPPSGVKSLDSHNIFSTLQSSTQFVFERVQAQLMPFFIAKAILKLKKNTIKYISK
jgi:hypothetical protein